MLVIHEAIPVCGNRNDLHRPGSVFSYIVSLPWRFLRATKLHPYAETPCESVKRVIIDSALIVLMYACHRTAFKAHDTYNSSSFYGCRNGTFVCACQYMYRIALGQRESPIQSITKKNVCCSALL